ncbi:ABC transporter substrate-binding protein [Kineococcus sp. LSe6-4]|uniref:ABC transporter substrate-binding protein n=1 Tax=Kineococcus halophytocola TaxID=3234027 RepID=A0ABV4H2Z5_9ACTN
MSAHGSTARQSRRREWAGSVAPDVIPAGDRPRSTPSRRAVLRAGLAGAAGIPLTAALASCGSQTSISSDPAELVLWYWNRSMAPSLLQQAARQIPGTSKHLRADVIGGSFDNKLRTGFAARAYVPDITAVNSNAALYFPSEDQFVDLDDYGAQEFAGDYYDWKWNLGRTPTGRFLFFPMDTGPTGFFYRADLFEAAGMPSQPDEVSAAVRTWDDWIAFGQQLRETSDVALAGNAVLLFNQFVNASPERFFDADDEPLFHRPDSAIRQAWDTAVKAVRAGVTRNLQVENEQNAAWNSGKLGAHIEGAWWMKVLSDTAPDLAGLWRIAQQPGLPGNSGGSFLAVPKTCKDPAAALAFARWLTLPENQAQSYNEVQLFPSAPAAFTSGLMADSGGFFGDQDPLAFFSTAAENVPTTFISTYERQVEAFRDQLRVVESAGKDPDQAWDDAVAAVDKILKKRGVI